MCCIWTIQTVIWCIWFSLLGSQSVTSGCRTSELADPTVIEYIKSSVTQGFCVEVNVRQISSEWRLLSHVMHDIPPWSPSFHLSNLPSLSLLLAFPNAELHPLYMCLIVSLIVNPFSSLHSPSSVSVFSHYPCHITAPLFSLHHSPFPISGRPSSLSTPLLTGDWPAANCVWFVHTLTGNMSTYLLKTRHTAALCHILFG